MEVCRYQNCRCGMWCDYENKWRENTDTYFAFQTFIHGETGWDGNEDQWSGKLPPRSRENDMKMDGKFYGQIIKAKDDKVVPEDEWVCFLVKDNAFAAILPVYRAMCASLGADAQQLAAVDRMIERATAWRDANPHRLKTPDAAGEKLLA